METVVVILMILVCFNYILKQTSRKIYSVMLSAVICAVFVGLMWPYAIEQSKSQISDWLADSDLMRDVAVVLTLEVAIQMAFCVLSAHIQTSGKIRKTTLWIYRILRWFPGILIFPVLFSLLVWAIFAMPGISFPAVAWGFAAIILAVIPLGSRILKMLLPEKEIRLELLFLANALIAILGIIATVNGQTAIAGVSKVDWIALGGVVAMLVTGFAAGSQKDNRRLSYNRKSRRYRPQHSGTAIIFDGA